MTTQSELRIRQSILSLPQYLPDATFGQVRSLGADATEACGIEALMMNTFHLMQRPGSSTVKSLGGLHAMSGWQKPIFTDSGGFQAYSLVRQDSRFGQLTDDGIVFKPEGAGRKFLLTPEKCIQLQVGFGSDVLFCLDDCTHVNDPPDDQLVSVQRTIQWARHCRQVFDRLLDEKKVSPAERPRLFAVIQGGSSIDLRRRCAEALLEMGFDGYGYGGWPLDSQGNLVSDMLALCRELVPGQFPMHALGVGHPFFVAQCAAMGYGLFDSAMPTRDARHGRLYRMRYQPTSDQFFNDKNWLEYVYVHDDRHIKESQPIEPGCDCPTCRRFSLAYIRHLYKLNDCLYQQTATQHNLRFMSRLMARLREILP